MSDNQPPRKSQEDKAKDTAANYTRRLVTANSVAQHLAGQNQREVAAILNLVITLTGVTGHVVPSYLAGDVEPSTSSGYTRRQLDTSPPKPKRAQDDKHAKRLKDKKKAKPSPSREISKGEEAASKALKAARKALDVKWRAAGGKPDSLPDSDEAIVAVRAAKAVLLRAKSESLPVPVKDKKKKDKKKGKDSAKPRKPKGTKKPKGDDEAEGGSDMQVDSKMSTSDQKRKGLNLD